MRRSESGVFRRQPLRCTLSVVAYAHESGALVICEHDAAVLAPRRPSGYVTNFRDGVGEASRERHLLELAAGEESYPLPVR